MTCTNDSGGSNALPLYYPETRHGGPCRNSSGPRDNRSVILRGQFRYDEPTNVWFIGPLSQEFMQAQVRWAELRLWYLYYRLRAVRRSQWASLMTRGLRLACSWYMQCDCMDMSADFLVRRVRNEFCIKKPRSRAELMQFIRVYGPV